MKLRNAKRKSARTLGRLWSVKFAGRPFKHALEAFPERFPNQETLAKTLGKSKSWVSQQIDVPEMVDELRQQGLYPGKAKGLTSRQVRGLRKLKPEERKRLIERSEELPSSLEIEEEAETPSKRARPAATGRPRIEPKPTGTTFECKVCGETLTVIHYTNRKHALRSVRVIRK